MGCGYSVLRLLLGIEVTNYLLKQFSHGRLVAIKVAKPHGSGMFRRKAVTINQFADVEHESIVPHVAIETDTSEMLGSQCERRERRERGCCISEVHSVLVS